MLARTLILLAALTTLAAAQAPDFEREVWPILKQACMDCHGAPSMGANGRMKKPKGGLRMDGKDWILKGGYEGPAVVAGSPDASPLWARVKLPADDADLMPPDGPRLKDDQLEVLRRWIEGGAEFGDWGGVKGPTVTKPAAKLVPGSGAARIAMLEKLGKGVAPAAAVSISKAAGEDARITPVLPASPLLRVEFPGSAGKVDDKRLKALSPVFGHVTQLIAGNTAITDKSLKTIAKMKRLTHLDLRGNSITAKELQHLARLTELRYLNLHGTEVDDDALVTIIRLSKLEAVYLWDTDVSEEGAARLQLKLPRCRVSYRLVLPAPATPAQNGPRRRRRNN